MDSTKDTAINFIVGLATLLAIGIWFAVVEDMPSLIAYVALIAFGGVLLNAYSRSNLCSWRICSGTD